MDSNTLPTYRRLPDKMKSKVIDLIPAETSREQAVVLAEVLKSQAVDLLGHQNKVARKSAYEKIKAANAIRRLASVCGNPSAVRRHSINSGNCE